MLIIMFANNSKLAFENNWTTILHWTVQNLHKSTLQKDLSRTWIAPRTKAKMIHILVMLIPHMNYRTNNIIVLKIINKLKSTLGLSVDEFLTSSRHLCWIILKYFFQKRNNKREALSNRSRIIILKVSLSLWDKDWNYKVVTLWVLFPKNFSTKLKKDLNFCQLVRFSP